MDLLAQHVGNDAGTIGSGTLKWPANRYWVRHAVTLTQLRGTFRVAEERRDRPVDALRRLRSGGHQRKR
jgi:hypothetical protein